MLERVEIHSIATEQQRLWLDVARVQRSGTRDRCTSGRSTAAGVSVQSPKLPGYALRAAPGLPRADVEDSGRQSFTRLPGTPRAVARRSPYMDSSPKASAVAV